MIQCNAKTGIRQIKSRDDLKTETEREIIQNPDQNPDCETKKLPSESRRSRSQLCDCVRSFCNGAAVS